MNLPALNQVNEEFVHYSRWNGTKLSAIREKAVLLYNFLLTIFHELWLTIIASLMTDLLKLTPLDRWIRVFFWVPQCLKIKADGKRPVLIFNVFFFFEIHSDPYLRSWSRIDGSIAQMFRTYRWFSAASWRTCRTCRICTSRKTRTFSRSPSSRVSPENNGVGRFSANYATKSIFK